MTSTNNVAVQTSTYLQSLVDYVLDVKPFRTKLAVSGAVSEQYLFSDNLNVKLTETESLKAFLGADLLPSSFTALGVRTRETNSWYQEIISDGVRVNWPMPNITIPKFSSSARLENFTIGVNDYQGIPGLISGVVDPKRWDGPGITDVRVNGVHQQDTVDYFLSHGVFSFDTVGVQNGVPSWIQHDLNMAVPTIEAIEGAMATGEMLPLPPPYSKSIPASTLAAYAAFSPLPGDLSYAEIQRTGGTITAITGETYEEFYLKCTSLLPATLSVYSNGDHSTVLGTVVLGSTFTLTDSVTSKTRIQFTYTYEVGHTVETATLDDEYLITPANRVVVSPDAPQETWSLIKTNPIGLASKPQWFPNPLYTRTAVPALEIHTRSVEGTPASSWTLTFNGDGTYILNSTLSGYPLTLSLIEGCSYRDANIAFTLIPTVDGWKSGDTFSWEISNSKPGYKVYGTVSGWQPDASVGYWYWNGKIGFKVPSLEMFAEVYNSTISSSTTGDALTWFTNVSGFQVFNSVSYSNGAFFAAGNDSIVGASADGVTWTNDIASLFAPPAGSHELLIVTGSGGTIAISADGITWHKERSGVTADLHASVNIPNFLASASSTVNDLNCIIVVGDAGTILTSIDGAGWAIQNSGTTENLNDIAWSNDGIIAVGDNGVILKSLDRLTWTPVTSNTTANLEAILYVAPTGAHPQGVFTVVGTLGTILRSTDGGNTWSNLAQFSDGTFSSVAYGNGEYVAVGPTGHVAKSADGIVWTRYSGKIYNSIAYGDGTFVAVGGSRNSTPQFIPLSPVSAMAVPSTYTITFTSPSDAAHGVKGEATVYHNIDGFKSNLKSDTPWADDVVSFQLNTIPGTYDYSIGDVVYVYVSPDYRGNITPPEPGQDKIDLHIPYLYNNEMYPLYHSYGAVIFPNAVAGDSIVVDKANFDKIKFRITGASGAYPELAAQDDWVPLFFKYSDMVDSSMNSTSAAEFSDLSMFVEAFSAATGERVFYITSPRYLKTNRSAQSVLTIDSAFFAKYLPFNTKYSIVVQPDQSYGQTIRVKVTDNLKIYARIQLVLADPIFITIADDAPDHLEIISEMFFGDGPITGYWRWEETTPPTVGPPATGWVYVTPFSDPTDQAWSYPFSIAVAEGGAVIIDDYDMSPYDVIAYDVNGTVPFIQIYESPSNETGDEVATSSITDGLSILMTVVGAYNFDEYDVAGYDTDAYDFAEAAVPPEDAGETTLNLTFDFNVLQPGGPSTVPATAPGLLITSDATNYIITLVNAPGPSSNIVYAPESNHANLGSEPAVMTTSAYLDSNGDLITVTDPNSITFALPAGITSPFRLWIV